MVEENKNGTGKPISFLVFSASLRKDSLNTRLAKLAKLILEKHDGVVDYATMSEFDCPSYNSDIETTSGISKVATEFNKRILANDALIIASPEYTGPCQEH